MHPPEAHLGNRFGGDEVESGRWPEAHAGNLREGASEQHKAPFTYSHNMLGGKAMGAENETENTPQAVQATNLKQPVISLPHRRRSLYKCFPGFSQATPQPQGNTSRSRFAQYQCR